MDADNDRNETEEPSAPDTENRAGRTTTRRKLLATGAVTWATVGLAGCSSGDDTETASQTDADTENGTGQNGTDSGAEDYIVSTNTYWNGHPAPEGTGGYVGSCSPERQFRRDMDVTFVMGVYDSDTGDTVSSDAVDSITVSFPDRPFDDVELTYSEPDDGAPRWNGTFDIPDDAETGSVAYEVQVTDGDADFHQVGIAAASFSIIDPSPMGEANYVVTTNTFWNGHPAPDGTNGFVGACSPERQFRPSDMDVTFVIGIYNSANGEFVGADAVDGINVTFPESDQFDPVALTYQPGEEDNTQEQWHGTLDLTGDTPAGTYTYQVAVEGAEYDIYDLGIASDTFTVLEE